MTPSPRDQRQFARVVPDKGGRYAVLAEGVLVPLGQALKLVDEAQDHADEINAAVREKVNEALEKTAATIESPEVFHFFMMPGLAGDKLKELAAAIRRMKEEA